MEDRHTEPLARDAALRAQATAEKVAGKAFMLKTRAEHMPKRDGLVVMLEDAARALRERDDALFMAATAAHEFAHHEGDIERCNHHPCDLAIVKAEVAARRERAVTYGY